MQQGGQGFGLPAAMEFFVNAQLRLFELLLFPGSSECGITADRLDACANAAAVLIALDQVG
jgi:hypothetical protein